LKWKDEAEFGRRFKKLVEGWISFIKNDGGSQAMDDDKRHTLSNLE